MKIKLFCFFFCISSFIRVTNAQTFTDNLKSYQSINYYIDQKEESNCIFCPASFTKSNLHNRLQNFFNEYNIPATLLTKPKYPYLWISVEDPRTAYTSGYDSQGNVYHHNADDYEVSFNLLDVIGGKTVIVYRLKFFKNTIDGDNVDEAKAYWNDVNRFLDQFSADWKATH